MDFSDPVTEKAKSVAGFSDAKKPRILLAACGCVGAIKFEIICNCFIKWAEVRAVVTQPSLHFIDRQSFPNDVTVYIDEHEMLSEKRKGGRVLHMELLEWADMMVIAPLSAHTLAKIVGGYCDSLLTSILRSWDYSSKQVFVAPSMHPLMWQNHFTQQHCVSIVKLGIFLIEPVSQRSPSGEIEKGGMADPSNISSTVRRFYDSKILKKTVGWV